MYNATIIQFWISHENHVTTIKRDNLTDRLCTILIKIIIASLFVHAVWWVYNIILYHSCSELSTQTNDIYYIVRTEYYRSGFRPLGMWTTYTDYRSASGRSSGRIRRSSSTTNRRTWEGSGDTKIQM